jgi:hypothetical protein
VLPAGQAQGLSYVNPFPSIAPKYEQMVKKGLVISQNPSKPPCRKYIRALIHWEN